MNSFYYDNSVFINCPFDENYKQMLYAIVFCVYRCGFIPRNAMEEDNALNNRLSKIDKIILECKFGIHDISRTEVNENGLPRFNMAFELGIFFGIKNHGNDNQKGKIALILEREKYLYQQYFSDLNGIDTTAHNNDPFTVIKIVRDWLQSSSKRKNIDGHKIIIKEFNKFCKNLPKLVKKIGLELQQLSFIDYCILIENFLQIEHMEDTN